MLDVVAEATEEAAGAVGSSRCLVAKPADEFLGAAMETAPTGDGAFNMGSLHTVTAAVAGRSASVTAAAADMRLFAVLPSPLEHRGVEAAETDDLEHEEEEDRALLLLGADKLGAAADDAEDDDDEDAKPFGPLVEGRI